MAKPMSTSARPANRVLVKKYRASRWVAIVAGSIAAGALLLEFGIILRALVASGATHTPPLVDVVGSAQALVYLFFAVVFLRELLSMTDLELADGQLRLPFRRHWRRRGWRSLEEILLLSISPHEDSVLQATSLARKARSGVIRGLVHRLRVYEWSKWGGLLAVTKDEVIWVRANQDVLRFLSEHWALR